MADIVTTLQRKGSPNDKIYPNIKTENIPNGAITGNKLSFKVYNNEINAKFSNGEFILSWIALLPIANIGALMSDIDSRVHDKSVFLQCNGNVIISTGYTRSIYGLRVEGGKIYAYTNQGETVEFVGLMSFKTAVVGII